MQMVRQWGAWQYKESRRASEQTRSEHHSTLTNVVRADFERLVPPHYEPNLASLLVLQQSDIACSALFPLEFGLGESEELCAPFISVEYPRVTSDKC